MPCFGIPPEPLHDEYWLVFTVAGLSEGKVKLQPKVRYKLNGETAFTELLGPQYDIEVEGFVDARLDSVGEWGEEEPGAFTAKDAIEQLMLRTCTAGNLTLSWNSDKIGLYTDPACEQQHKVAEDESSVEGSRRATCTETARPVQTKVNGRWRWAFPDKVSGRRPPRTGSHPPGGGRRMRTANREGRGRERPRPLLTRWSRTRIAHRP